MKTAKKKPGRPKMDPELRGRPIEVYLRETTIERARAIGGNVSRGIDMAVTEYWNGIQPKRRATK
jgi:post-segregation antitoxin (ccd killing protein)